MKKKRFGKVLKQIAKFVGFSGIGWLLDFMTYIFLEKLSGNLMLDNIISSWVGVSFVFAFATRKVFYNNNNLSLAIKYLIYIGYQFILIILISKILTIINISIVTSCNFVVVTKYAYIISKILVTPITMTLNFIVMKSIIEKL